MQYDNVVEGNGLTEKSVPAKADHRQTCHLHFYSDFPWIETNEKTTESPAHDVE